MDVFAGGARELTGRMVPVDIWGLPSLVSRLGCISQRLLASIALIIVGVAPQCLPDIADPTELMQRGAWPSALPWRGAR